MPIGICLQRESTEVLHRAFGHFFYWCKNAEKNGIASNGNEPTMLPIKLVATGDMSFESKLLGTGGACKVKKHFCPWCEVNGEVNMWHERYGVDQCIICVDNGREKWDGYL